MKRLFLTIVFIASVAITTMAQDIDNMYRIIPLQKEITATPKFKPFILSAGTVITTSTNDERMKRNATFLQEFVEEALGIKLVIAENAKKGTSAISLSLNPKLSSKGNEYYQIDINQKGIAIQSATAEGTFRATEALRKILNNATVNDNGTLSMSAVHIADSPRFGYRGMHLDCARHFFSIDFVKEYIDLIALHGMNKFHWHLTDDQGWRIEIKKYPELTRTGGWRTGTLTGRNSDADDRIPYGGFYTQDEMREIVRYAAERYITVIPEIDMPGHMMAALTAYPQYGCTGGPYEVGHKWGIYYDILCAGKDETFSFIEDILDELTDIFPSELIHIGGDEAPRERWQNCKLCQARIRELGFKAEGKRSAEDLLQGYFMQRIEKHLNNKGRRIIGWDELLEQGVGTSATIMAWRGIDNASEGLKEGHDVIMTPTSHCYFDFNQCDGELIFEPLLPYWGLITVEKVYSLDAPKNITDEQASHILGLQANVWTEYLYGPGLVEYQVLPRMAALCEAQWTAPEKKDYNDFISRLKSLANIYKKHGWQYAKHTLRPADEEVDRFYVK